jgi:hypothetical protein
VKGKKIIPDAISYSAVPPFKRIFLLGVISTDISYNRNICESLFPKFGCLLTEQITLFLDDLFFEGKKRNSGQTFTLKEEDNCNARFYQLMKIISRDTFRIEI